jgi:glycosyltransferase involved in cell wall biosynthesis
MMDPTAANGASASAAEHGVRQPGAAVIGTLRKVAQGADTGTDMGVNLIGDITCAIGLSTATRATLDALIASDLPVSYLELRYPFDRHDVSMTPAQREHMRGNVYPLNLLFYNMHELSQLSDARLWALTRGKYTIGYWFWELPTIPAYMREQAQRVDEIWVASTYMAGNLAAVTNVPVTVLPPPVAVAASSQASRTRFGIPQDRYVFLFTFSPLSGDSRKNPWGLVEAFRRAFGAPNGRGAPLLVIKGHYLGRHPALRTALAEQVARVGGMLLDADYSRQDVIDLLACADAYVSLHRAEGFGLGMAEAMHLGKPVIATNYSSNTDFMSADNSYLVDYRLRTIVPEHHRFTPEMAEVYAYGQVWADPDLDQAAALMRQVYEHPDEARHRGERAAQAIRSLCGPHEVAERMAARLRAIEPRGAQPPPPWNVTSGDDPAHADSLAAQRDAVERWEDVVTVERRAPLARFPVVGTLTRAMTRLASLGRSAEAQVIVNRATFDALMAQQDELALLRGYIEWLEERYKDLNDRLNVPTTKE